MQTTSPFDLNQAIQRWREDLGQSPAFRSENLYELETHLRDSIAALQRQGLSAEESFLVAAKRLGRNSSLEAEFAKQNTRSVWLDRALWILIGAQLWGLAGNLANYLKVFINISLPKANEWLATYGLGRIPESVPAQICYVIALPLTLLVGTQACFIIHRWAEKRGWSPFFGILNRPRLLAGVYALLCLSPLMFDLGVGLLVAKFGLQRAFSLQGMSGYTLAAMVALHTAMFAALVMVIARKRLISTRA